MFETLKRLFLGNRLDGTGIQNAVEKNWITPAQGEQILALRGAETSGQA